MRCLDMRVPHEPVVRPRLVVAEDEDDIGSGVVGEGSEGERE